MPSSSSKSKSKKKESSSSSIKGGGRTVLSDETEDLIVDLLMKLRDEKNPLQPKRHNDGAATIGKVDAVTHKNADDDNGTDDENEDNKKSSSHSQKRERKRFLKRLVECHQRDALSRKLNQVGIDEALSDAGSGERKDKSAAEAQHKSDGGKKIGGDSGAEVSGKIRIDLIEAIYESSSKKSKKDKKSYSKKEKDSKKKKRPWKDGPTKKTLVLQRSTSISELLKNSKSKLQMKKKPIRCFYVGENKIEMDLKVDLSGLEDGCLVYVTSNDGHEKDDEKTTGDVKKKGAVGENDNVETVSVIQEDPLESVKKAYALRRNKKRARELNCRKSTEYGAHRSALNIRGGDQPIHQNIPLSEILRKLEPLPPSRADLPAASFREEILKALDTSRVVVICGATGCGKSTQVPQYLLEYMNARNLQSHANILVTQPRRVAATSLAERVAFERSSAPPGKPGSTIGYNVRLSRAIADSTKIVYCTVGILLRMLVNPSESTIDATAIGDDNKRSGVSVPLSSLSHVVIDEVHERDLNTDFVLTLLRPVLKFNPRIRIILMSATASADLFANYFRVSGMVEPQILSIPGRTFPVTHVWLPDCEHFAKTRIRGWIDHRSASATDTKILDEEESEGAPLSPRASEKIDDNFVCRLVCAIVRDQQKGNGGITTARKDLQSSSQSQAMRSDGAILIFLPGKGEIESLAKVLSSDSLLGNKDTCQILRLHSTLPRGEQNVVFQPVPTGTIKIVLATNVAETSITIPDISVVIETGRVKESRFNPLTRIKELVTVWTSQASATQRAGRAGRTGPGICYKLYSEEFYKDCMLERTSPEIFRTPLDELILQVCLLYEHKRGGGSETDVSSEAAVLSLEGVSPLKFLRNAPEPPTTHSLLHACKHLLEVGALTVTGRGLDGPLFRLTPLGYHLSHLPMDAKVGKVLIVGCILECLDPALTIAAALSCSKTCWSVGMRNPDDGTYSKQKAREAQETLVRNGFGGEGWKGGTVKGDLIAVVAAYKAWASLSKEKERRQFAFRNALDHNALREMYGLRLQFRGYLIDAGFIDDRSSSQSPSWLDSASDDANLTSCCLVAGLYPNIATLLRPAKGRGNLKGGRLITKEGDVCRPSSNSFQVERIRNASESGSDAYAVFHAKHRTVGTQQGTSLRNESFLSEVNFVSKYALLLFGGEVDVNGNAIVLDGWLKFKVGDKGETGAVLIQELRKELDIVMTKHILMEEDEKDEDKGNNMAEKECLDVMEVVRKLLVEKSKNN